jgi:hypothetical protein
MKTILLLAVLALSCVGLHAQTTNLVDAPTPPPHALAAIDEAQFDAIVGALPSLPSGQTASTVQSVSVYGSRILVQFIPVGGVSLSASSVLNPTQVAAIIAAGPSLPSGESATTVRSYSAHRSGSNINLFVQFTQ